MSRLEHRTIVITLLMLICAMTCPSALAQPAPTMSFFATSVGNGVAGGNYGGLDGADARCQSLAMAVGAGDRTWRAYLSTAPIMGFGGVLVHARDRIGTGPWYNFDGTEVAANVANLHTNGITPALILTELGMLVPTNEHDILAGTLPDGTAMEQFPGNPMAPGPTCFNWTSNDAGAYGYVGHSDWIVGQSWNSQHEVFCDQAGLASTAGSGRIYCFAVAASEVLFRDGFEG